MKADHGAENYGRNLMLEANRNGKMGFEMARACAVHRTLLEFMNL